MRTGMTPCPGARITMSARRKTRVWQQLGGLCRAAVSGFAPSLDIVFSCWVLWAQAISFKITAENVKRPQKISRLPRQSRNRTLILIAAIFCVVLPCKAQQGEPSELDIARATAIMLEASQFPRRSVDFPLSSRFLDNYLNAMDSDHSLFLRSDLDALAGFREDLAWILMEKGDTRAAYLIFGLYMNRLSQEVTFATNFLRHGRFDFTGHDLYQVDRSDAPPPLDLGAAQKLWRQKVRADYLLEKLVDTPIQDIVAKLEQRYERSLESVRQLSSNQILEIYLDALAHAYDAHSDYMGCQQTEEFKTSIDLSFSGIGVAVQTRNGCCVITEIIPGGPAARSGLLKPGDRIVAVAQGSNAIVNLVDMPLLKIAELMRGPKGSTVRLTVIPAGSVDS